MQATEKKTHQAHKGPDVHHTDTTEQIKEEVKEQEQVSEECDKTAEE